MKQKTDKSVLASIRSLEVGERYTAPANRLYYVRAQCSNLGAMLSRKYSTHFCRESRTITVQRIS